MHQADPLGNKRTANASVPLWAKPSTRDRPSVHQARSNGAIASRLCLNALGPFKSAESLAPKAIADSCVRARWRGKAHMQAPGALKSRLRRRLVSLLASAMKRRPFEETRRREMRRGRVKV